MHALAEKKGLPPKESLPKPASKKITKQHLQHAQAIGCESVERDDLETETALDRDYAEHADASNE